MMKSAGKRVDTHVINACKMKRPGVSIFYYADNTMFVIWNHTKRKDFDRVNTTRNIREYWMTGDGTNISLVDDGDGGD